MQPGSIREADALLDELERTLEREREALRTLNLAEIERAAETKAQIDTRMRALAERGAFESKHRERVTTLRASAVENQLLLAHARTCVRGAIAAATGTDQVGYGGKRPSSPTVPAAAPVRVNVRG